jgi:N-acetylmuramoyl-L-alanine amidase
MLVGLLLVVGLVVVAVRVVGGLEGAFRTISSAAAQPPGAVKLDAPGTGASACLEYAPTGASRKRTVFLDPGHGGPDPGASGRTPTRTPVLEKVETLAVAEALATRLRADGYAVVLSRTQDTTVAGGLTGTSLSIDDERRDLQARVDCANTARADVLLSIHFNGFFDPSARGTETFFDSARPFAAQNLRLARSVQSALVGALRLQDRGALSDDQLDAPTLTDAGATYGHLVQLGPAQPGLVDRASAMPGALTEPLFVTAPSEAALVATTDGRERIANALASGLEGFLR